MNRKITLIVLIFFFFIFLVFPVVTLYAGLVPCGLSKDDPDQKGDQTVPCQFCHFFVLFDNVMKFLLIRIVPVLAALMVAIGGFMFVFAYLTAEGGGGEPALISQAKKLFSSVAIGLIIAYGAWFFVNLFFQLIGVADWTGLKEGWWKINCPGF